jgi:Thiol-disulfide isomerase and thioredoxins
MNKYILFLGIIFLTYGAGAQKTTLKFNFNDRSEKLQIQIGDEKIYIEPGKKGKATYKAKITSPQYIKILRIPSRPELLYVYPNDKLEVSIAGPNYGDLEFKGKNAALNAYLVDPKSIVLGGGLNFDEAGYTDFLKAKVEERIANLKSLGFTQDFIEKEQKRIAVKIYTSMVGYPNIRRRTERGYKASEFYYGFVNDKIFENEEMLFLNEYTDFIQYMYNMMATKDIVKYDAFTYAETTLNYVINNVKSEKIKAHLINYYAYDYLKRNGILKVDPITKVFKTYVKDPAHIETYNNTWETWSKITPGRVMPDFTFYDINDKAIPLSSLKGKYIYIDVWATWCKPCIAEIPNLKKMEHEMKGKNIVFVSISTDKDSAAWKKMLVKDNFTGIQWHTRSREFSNELMIVSIPRFILIDPQGKMVDANVSRPNRPETYQLMETLPGL